MPIPKKQVRVGGFTDHNSKWLKPKQQQQQQQPVGSGSEDEEGNDSDIPDDEFDVASAGGS